MDCTNKSPLRVVYGDVTVGVHGKEHSYIFSYAQGGLESLVKHGMEWLYRAPKPTFWRALTDNDRGSQFHIKSGMWLAADQFIECVDVEVWMDGISQGKPCAPQNNCYGGDVFAEEMAVKYTYRTITNPSVLVWVTYTIDRTEQLHVDVRYGGAKGAPQLPVFGLRFQLPTLAERYRYEGLSGETYPDRKRGAEKGIYEIDEVSLTPYLMPQDCGMHMDTEWLEIYRSTRLDNRRQEKREQSLRIEKAGETFAFSCLPYTALEIESATHQEELPPARRTVLCVYGAVRGVGGIDSWGSDVETPYQVSGEKEIQYAFVIK